MTMTEREFAEKGRKYQLAWEIVEAILSGIHDDAVTSLQTSMLDDESLRRKNAVLYITRIIGNEIRTAIQRGEIAEEALANGE